MVNVIKLLSMNFVLILESQPIRTVYPIHAVFWLDNFKYKYKIGIEMFYGFHLCMLLIYLTYSLVVFTSSNGFLFIVNKSNIYEDIYFFYSIFLVLSKNLANTFKSNIYICKLFKSDKLNLVVISIFRNLNSASTRY